MSGRADRLRGAVVVSLVGLCVLGLTGCRGADRVAAPAVTTPSSAVAETPGRPTAGAAGRGGSAQGGSGGSADPLADVEASVDAVSRDLDADADAGR